MKDNVDEVDSLCTTYLSDFSENMYSVSTDPNFFDIPTWPQGEWPLTMFDGYSFTYKNDGQTSGALFQGDRVINCDGNLGQHGTS
jgi:uncharacterized RDD family membrane protein YckC